MDDVRIAIVGAGYMGGGIAQSLALAGHRIALADSDPGIARAAVERLRSQLAEYAERGLVDAAAAVTGAGLISAADSIGEAVAGAGYITEAVPERLKLKAAVLGEIGAAADPHAVIATNTSALPIRELARAVPSPQRFLAVHWFNPAPFVPLVELTGGTEEVTWRVEAMLCAAGKVPVRVPDVPGFLGNRLQFALYREAALIVEEGLADAATVDAVVTNSFGMRLPFFGPLLVGDIAGLDVYEGAFRSLQAHYGERLAPPSSLVERVASGDFGLKAGGGIRGVPPERRRELDEFRDRASVAITRLRASVGWPPTGGH